MSRDDHTAPLFVEATKHLGALAAQTTKLTGAPVRARPVERIVRRQREYQPGAGQQHWHPTYGQLRAMPVERRPSAKRNPPDRQGDRNAFEQP